MLNLNLIKDRNEEISSIQRKETEKGEFTHTCSGVFLCLSAISATTDNFSIGPCTDLDLLNDIRGVPGSSSPPELLSDGPGAEEFTPKGV